jgi:two-component system invasion response regulator UvrY
MKRVLLADDHPIFRNGLKLILTYEMDMYVAEATNGVEALEYLQNNTVDLVIVDLDLPGINGLDVIRNIRKSRSNIPILMMSALPADEYTERAIKAGASGFLNKQADKLAFTGAVRALFREQQYRKEPVEQRQQPAKNEQDILPHKHLSDREYEVFCLLASGKSVGDIAEKLHLSDKTVSTHRTRLLRKMNLSTNADLTNYALKHELIRLV